MHLYLLKYLEVDFFHHLQPDLYIYEGNVLHDLFGSCSSLNIDAAGENFFG